MWQIEVWQRAWWHALLVSKQLRAKRQRHPAATGCRCAFGIASGLSRRGDRPLMDTSEAGNSLCANGGSPLPLLARRGRGFAVRIYYRDQYVAVTSELFIRYGPVPGAFAIGDLRNVGTAP